MNKEQKPSAPQEPYRGPVDANRIEAMAKERPDDCFLKGSGILKLTGAIRTLEAKVRELEKSLRVGPMLDNPRKPAAQPTAPIVTPDFDGAPCHVCGADGVHLREQSGRQPSAPQVDWQVLALDLEQQARRVELQAAQCAMRAAAHGLRLMEAMVQPSAPLVSNEFSMTEAFSIFQDLTGALDAIAKGQQDPEEIAHLILKRTDAAHPRFLAAHLAALSRVPAEQPTQGTQGVPDSRPIHDQQADEPQVDERCRYFWRTGWNACRSAMLAAAPKPPAEQEGGDK
jgi:hypothetical protein